MKVEYEQVFSSVPEKHWETATECVPLSAWQSNPHSIYKPWTPSSRSSRHCRGRGSSGLLPPGHPGQLHCPHFHWAEPHCIYRGLRLQLHCSKMCVCQSRIYSTNTRKKDEWKSHQHATSMTVFVCCPSGTETHHPARCCCCDAPPFVLTAVGGL